MEELINVLKSITTLEKYRGILNYGTFNSTHEAYSVTLEELQEAQEELTACSDVLNYIWNETKNDTYLQLTKDYDLMYKRAINAAAECVQVAAMCSKATEFLKQYEFAKGVKNE